MVDISENGYKKVPEAHMKYVSIAIKGKAIHAIVASPCSAQWRSSFTSIHSKSIWKWPVRDVSVGDWPVKTQLSATRWLFLKL
jgi:hypothetical protein